MNALRVVVVCVFVLVATSSSALAAGCPEGARCGRVTVPLDHSGSVAGTVSIAYATLPATGARTGTLVFLTGGPGQSAVPLLDEFASLLKPLRSSYDIVAVDQRGTGASGAVDCKFEGLQDVPACATKLGAARPFWSTLETARDLENLRVALGVDKLTLYGVSYGTNVAGEYARLYPDHVASLVLDSPTPVDGLDGVDVLRAFGVPRMLREVCFPGICHQTISDPDAALDKAAARLQEGSLSGPLVSASGRVRTVHVGEDDLYSALQASDLNPILRAGLPAAIASLANGDAAPFLHLGAVVPSGGGGGGDDTSESRLLATTCIESRLPWAPDSSLASRDNVVETYGKAHAEAFAPFSPQTVLLNSATLLCALWPPTPAPAPVSYMGPNVPVLVISGRQDLRTPLEDARRTLAQYPNGQLLAVRSAGHSVLSTDPTGCARAGIVAFLRSAAVQTCSSRGPDEAALPAAPYIPATIGALRPTGASGLAGRTFSALRVTLTGVGFDSIGYSGSFRLPGLRAGYVRGSRTTLELFGVEWIRGVRVSGRIDARSGRGTLTVSGPEAAAGTVNVSKSGAHGVLGGTPVSSG